ncbi:MAG: hypothetical protein PWP35_786 [Bacteroidales bacterium]|jgi:hypothetical protein|nr:hypothetical protein [Bacteroidales bacterium]
MRDLILFPGSRLKIVTKFGIIDQILGKLVGAGLKKFFMVL